MANLIEQSQWELGVYQLETEDPVLGGADGIDNLQAKQLANRTQYLKNLVTSLQSLIAGILNTSDYKASVRVASTGAINLAAPGANIDGVAMVAGDRFLEKDNATLALRGIYIWNGAAAAATRATDADIGAELNGGAIIPVEEGTVNKDTIWQITNDGTVTIGVTGLTFKNTSGLTAAEADLKYISTGYMLIRDEKAANVDAGTSTTGSQVRTLNTVSSNTISGASLSANVITLPAGTYRIKANAIAIANTHSAYFYNETNASVIIAGTSEQAAATGDTTGTRSFITGRFTITTTKNFTLRHFMSAGLATYGLGYAANSGNNEVYSEVEIIKES